MSHFQKFISLLYIRIKIKAIINLKFNGSKTAAT